MTVARPLTDTQLRKLRVTGERYELPDPGLPGLALRISSKGQKTWTVVYRVRGSGEVAGERVARLAGAKRRLTLGEYPAVGLAEARAKAAEVKRLARSGVDTSAASIQDDSQSNAPIVADLIDRYVTDHLRRNKFRAGSNAEKQLRLHVGGAWNTRPVVSITRTDLVLLLEKVRIQFEVQLRHGDRVERRKRGGPGAACRSAQVDPSDVSVRGGSWPAPRQPFLRCEKSRQTAISGSGVVDGGTCRSVGGGRADELPMGPVLPPDPPNR